MSGRTVGRLLLVGALVAALAGPAAAGPVPEAPAPRPAAPAEAQPLPFKLDAGTFKLVARADDCALGALLGTKRERGVQLELKFGDPKGVVIEIVWAADPGPCGLSLLTPPRAVARLTFPCAVADLMRPCAISRLAPACALARILPTPCVRSGSFSDAGTLGLRCTPPTGMWGCLIPSPGSQPFWIDVPHVVVKETRTGTFMLGCAAPCPRCGFVQTIGSSATDAPGRGKCESGAHPSDACPPAVANPYPAAPVVKPFVMPCPPAAGCCVSGVKVIRYDAVEPCPLCATATRPADPLLGTWYRELPGMVVAVTFTPDELKLCVTHATEGGEAATITIVAQYTLTKDGLVFGAITGADAEGPSGPDSPVVPIDELAGVFNTIVDCPFSFRTKMTSAGLMVSAFKLGGKLGAEGGPDQFAGMLKRSKDGTVPKAKAPKSAGPSIGLGEPKMPAGGGLPGSGPCLPPPLPAGPGVERIGIDFGPPIVWTAPPNVVMPCPGPVYPVGVTVPGALPNVYVPMPVPCPGPYGIAPPAPLYPGAYGTPVTFPVPPAGYQPPAPAPLINGYPVAPATAPPGYYPVKPGPYGEPAVICPPAPVAPSVGCPGAGRGPCSGLADAMRASPACIPPVPPSAWNSGPPNMMKLMAVDAFDQLLVQQGVIPPSPCPVPPAVLPAARPAPSPPTVPMGTWTRDLGPRKYVVTFARDHFTVTISWGAEVDGKPLTAHFTLTADCCPTRDCVTLVGLITGVDVTFEGKWPAEEVESALELVTKVQKELEEKPFAMKVRLYGNALVIGDVRLPSKLDTEDIPFATIAGRYTIAADKPKASAYGAPTMSAPDTALHLYGTPSLHAGAGLTMIPLGCKVWCPNIAWEIEAERKYPSTKFSGMTLPSSKYQQHRPQYFANPQHPLPRELASMEDPEGAARRAGGYGTVTVVPSMPEPTPPGVPLMSEPTAPVFPMPEPVKPDTSGKISVPAFGPIGLAYDVPVPLVKGPYDQKQYFNFSVGLFGSDASGVVWWIGGVLSEPQMPEPVKPNLPNATGNPDYEKRTTLPVPPMPQPVQPYTASPNYAPPTGPSVPSLTDYGPLPPAPPGAGSFTRGLRAFNPLYGFGGPQFRW